MSALPINIHSVAQVRALDAEAMQALDVSAYALMQRAGEAAFAAMRSGWPMATHIAVICGFGNNAGDGYVLATLAQAARMDVKVIALGDPAELKGAAMQAWQGFNAGGGVVQHWDVDVLRNAEVIVDAIFGTGLSRPLSAELQSQVQEINDSGKPILSLDIPSGLDADTGAVMGAAIEAHRTICFVGLKQGFYLGEGPNHVGHLLFDDLDIPLAVSSRIDHVAQRLDSQIVSAALPRRARTSHKGQQGHVLIIGSGTGMPGAVRLAGEACLRAGAGLVTVATRPEHIAILAGRPELICAAVNAGSDLAVLMEHADIIAIGPGLGRDAWAESLLDAVLNTGKPLVVDADALNLLALHPVKRSNWILTPHPGEAARLLNTTTQHVQQARMASAHRIADLYGGVVVLKGAGTLVWDSAGKPGVCDRGNPGMAAPGMGDVLTGVIAGIAAQCGDLCMAARAGVYVHGVAGDMAARHGERGLLASDLFAHLPSCVNP
ncbi:MAG TPA: NAD(P)H-hydrate dehydratase [Steroidobacteraceae bacterium]|nr:NAD(P)H-hydrate dehydratase [Steroidobacteraceae bacterium]